MLHSIRTPGHASAATVIATIALTASSLICGASTVAAQGTVAAGGATALQGDGTPPKKALAGSWVETVTFPAEFGRPPGRAVGTFHGDGTLVFNGSVTLDPPTAFSTFHGVWRYLEKSTFAYTGVHLMTDLSDNLVGYVKVRGTYVVSPSGNEYTGTSVAEVLDSGGNVLFSVGVTNTGTRIQLELP
jgi:hypothetical protein